MSKTDTTADTAPNEGTSAGEKSDPMRECSKSHLAIGWWSLLIFLSLGIVLEILHGLKVSTYLDVGNETRRLMWTLAHAHGTLLALIHIAFSVTVPMIPKWTDSSRRLASRTLTAAGILMPLGFFLGGVQFYGGDPGLGILLLPAGALCLFAAVLKTARAIH
jgi:hypothetical protein